MIFENIIFSLILGFTSGLFAWVFLKILTEHGSILDFYKPFVQKYVTMRNPAKPILKLDKVLTQCPRCLGGQIALISYFVSSQDYSIMTFILCVCTAILTATILETKIKI